MAITWKAQKVEILQQQWGNSGKQGISYMQFQNIINDNKREFVHSLNLTQHRKDYDK